MARLVVSGYMLRHPVAGNVAAFLQYVIGLQRLGHDVTYVEEKGWDGSCYDPRSGQCGDYPVIGLSIVRELVARHCRGVPVIWVDGDTGVVDGAKWSDLRERLAGADLLLDVGGLFWLEERTLARRRALVDMDPLFTQAGRFAAALHEYDAHFSYGANVGRSGCTVPAAGHDWLPTVPPVVMDLWEAPAPNPAAPFTTIANWSAYGGIEHDGAWYGQKDAEFERLVDLPGRTDVPLELALAGAGPEVTQRFARAGWRLRDAGEATATLESYRAYIAGSQGELSAAKHAYVATRSGWFSDRSVCYLAAGRPVVVQDTGIEEWLGTGEGVLTFQTAGEAADALGRVAGDLPRHCGAAHRLAARVFDARVALPQLLARALPRQVEAVA